MQSHTQRNDSRTEAEITADVLKAAREGLKNWSHDSTANASYNRRRAYDAGFNAAMAALRDVPIDERPDGLVEEVDELVATLKERDKFVEDAVEALEAAIEDALMEPITPERGPWVHVADAADAVEAGEEVTVMYRPHSGDPDEEPGAYETVTATVTKVIDTGAVFLAEEHKYASGRTFKLHNVPGGTVTGTHTYGSRTVRHGLRARVLVEHAN